MRGHGERAPAPADVRGTNQCEIRGATEVLGVEHGERIRERIRECRHDIVAVLRIHEDYRHAQGVTAYRERAVLDLVLEPLRGKRGR